MVQSQALKNIRFKIVSKPDKHTKSVFSGKQFARIVDKITRVMRDNKLYMDANLTLKKTGGCQWPVFYPIIFLKR